MNNKFRHQIFAIILIATAAISAYSFTTASPKVCGVEIRKSGIREFVAGDTSAPAIMGVYESEYKPHSGIDSSKQKILLIGDSMLEQFRWRLRDYCKENGHSMASVIWYSSQTEWFGTSDTLKYYINKVKYCYESGRCHRD